MNRREVKGKKEKERYTHLNAEFQRIPRRDKEAFFSDQCKEIEENNRMGKTRDLFKKIRATKGIFDAKMGSIKDRNGMDATEAEDIKKRWQEYWSGLPFPSPGDLPDPGIKARSPALEADALASEPPGKPQGLLRQPFCFFAFVFLEDGLDPYLLYNVMNLHP